MRPAGSAPPAPDFPDRVVFFDGTCNLCNGAVRFILRNDDRQRFRFAPLQSAAGRRFLKAHGLPTDAMDTLVYWRKGKVLARSTGALNICRDLRRPWPLLALFLVVPRFLRDPLYRLLSRKRYTWFGRQDTCMVPSPGQARFFLKE